MGEYIKTLKEIINEDGVLPWKWSINIAIQVASALETAHKNNIVHRDIKGVVGTGIEFIKGVIKSIDTVFADNPILNLLIPIIGIPRIIIANWSSIKGFFVSLWGGIKSSAESMWSSISSGASNAWNSIVGFFNPIGNWFAAKWEGVKLLTGAVWAGIKSIVSAAWNGLISIITNSSLFQSVVNGWTRIFDYLGTLKDKMLNIGKNIIDGLVSGIKSGFDSLKSTWASINNYMPSFMKKKMDIHSPSRVMAGLGGHIVDGIGVGMLQRKPALESQFNSVLGTFNSSANTPSINAISPSPRSTTPSMGGNSQSNAVNDKKQDITIVIHAAPGQDVNQLADLVAQKLNRAKAAIKRGSMLDAGYAQ